MFLLSSFFLALAHKIGFHPVISLVDPGNAASHWASPVGPSWSTWTLPWIPRSVEETLGTVAVLSELSAILTGRFREVREDWTALPPEKFSGRGIHSSLAQLTSGVDHTPWPGASVPHRVRPGRNGASLAISIIHPV